MGQPVVHFEIIGRDPTGLRDFFGALFEWEFDTSGPVSDAVSEPDDYGFLDLLVAADGTGIRGGVGGGPEYRPRVVVYVGVPDVEDALARAQALGAERRMGPVTAPNGLVIGQLADPAGNLIGLASIG